MYPDLPEWLGQSPGQTFCHVLQSTDRLHRRSWPCQPWPGSPCSGLSCARCCWGIWALHSGTMTTGTPRSRSLYRTGRPDCPRCLALSVDSPWLSGALWRDITAHLLLYFLYRHADSKFGYICTNLWPAAVPPPQHCRNCSTLHTRTSLCRWAGLVLLAALWRSAWSGCRAPAAGCLSASDTWARGDPTLCRAAPPDGTPSPHGARSYPGCGALSLWGL